MVTFNSLIRSLLVLYVSIESVDCIILLSFELNTILLISSLKMLYPSILIIGCVFNIDLLFFKDSL